MDDHKAPQLMDEKEVRQELRAALRGPITPVITIFVRHTPGCKYAGDEFCKRATAASISDGATAESSTGSKPGLGLGPKRKRLNAA